jgi:hypothetical protein
MCENKEALVGFLYGELGPAEQHAFERHLAECAGCRSEIVGLQAARGHLASWVPPDADLGFRIVRGTATPPVRRVFAPAWGLAAAAVLVLAAAAALANIEVKYGADGVTVRTGWGRTDAQLASAPAASGVAAPQGAAAVPSVDLEAIDARLRELEAAAAKRPPAAVSASAPANDAEIYRRVRQMIGDAQTQQQQQFAILVAQVVKDFDRQRRVDLAAIQQGLGQYQGLTNAEIAQQRDALNQLWRVAATGRDK